MLFCLTYAAHGAANRVEPAAPLQHRQPTAMQRYIEHAEAALQAADAANKEQAPAAAAALAALVDDPLYDMLPKVGQRILVSSQAWATWTQGDIVGARDLYLKATRIDGNEPDDWYRLAILENHLGELPSSARYMTAFVRRWPDLVNNLDLHVLSGYAFDSDSNAAWRSDVLQALFDAKWDDAGNGVDGVWRHLALLYLAKGDHAAAATVAERIADPLIIVSMRSDKRFDPIAASIDKLPSAREAAEHRIEALRGLLAKQPKRVDLVSTLGSQLLVAGRHEEVLSLLDETLKAIAADPSSFEALDKKNWLMNQRAIALRRLGRFDEALAEIERASQVDEHGDPNVSQVLNLATFYCNAGHPKEALRAMERVGLMSPYGRMVQSAVRHCAALQMGNRRAADEEVAYMLEHRKVSEAIVLETLLTEGRVDEAAKLLISHFADPTKVDDALGFVQEFKTAPELPGYRALHVHRRELLARDDVKAAAAQVGRMGVHDVFDNAGI